MTTVRALLLCLSFALAFAGCAGMSPVADVHPGITGIDPQGDVWMQRWGVQAPQSGHEAVPKAAAAMLEGIRLYDDGDFKSAIARLSSVEIRSAPAAIRVEALKYIAFSYCVTSDFRDCRHAFDTALGIDAGFELGKGEGGHPMWGPVFRQAKTASDKDRALGATSQERERLRSMDTWRPR